jgi:hypothetical protein
LSDNKGLFLFHYFTCLKNYFIFDKVNNKYDKVVLLLDEKPLA